jgi:hypothetical protein
LNANRLIVGTLAASMTSVAIAGPTVLGTPMGGPLGVTLGRVFGTSLGSLLPIAGGGLLIVAAASLMIGISIVRRKKNR